jgi:replication initiation and membrane attachment protein DnaB
MTFEEQAESYKQNPELFLARRKVPDEEDLRLIRALQNRGYNDGVINVVIDHALTSYHKNQIDITYIINIADLLKTSNVDTAEEAMNYFRGMQQINENVSDTIDPD